MYNYNLALMAGTDIPCLEIQAVIHQPTIKEISMIGEEDFFMGLQILCLNKKMYIQDESLLSETTNFQIFMMMMNEKKLGDKKEAVKAVLTLIFPLHQITFTPRGIVLSQNGELKNIDDTNFETLQQYLQTIFCLSQSGQQSFNPVDEKAKKIAEKLMRGRERLAKQKAENQENSSMFGQYLSVLTVGLGSMSLKDCLDLTMFQLYDLIERYTLYINWDIDLRSRLAGAKADKPLENWMKNIHEKKQ